MIPKEPYMDMHTHILPGLDDGASSMEQTMNMLKQAYDEGIRVIVATPHFGVRNPDYLTSEAEAVLKETRRVADEITPGLKLVLGNELFYTDGISDSLQRGEAKTIGGTSYALVEFSTRDSYDRIVKCIREFTWAGYRPVIAHVERYGCVEGDVEAVRNLVNQGAVIQVNCRSFMNGSNGGNRESTKRKSGLFRKKNQVTGFTLEQKSGWVRKLIEANLVHLIGSDCHDDDFRRPVYRSALEAMDGWCSDEQIHRITKENILRLIRNEAI